MKLSKHLLGGLSFIALAMAGGSVAAQSLEARVAELEKRLEKEEARTGMLTATGFNLSFYGYAKLDAIHDFDYALGNTTGGMANIGLGSVKGSDDRLHAFQSRLGLRGSQETDLGKLSFAIEGDFFGGGGGSFRLRQAWGQLGGFMAGQAWGLWSPLAETPNVADFNGVGGIAGYRVAQVRYTHQLSETLSLAGAVEADYVSWGAKPALTAALTWKASDIGSVQLGAISRSLKRVGGGESDAWGATLSGNFRLWEGGLIQATYTKGEGVSSLLTFSAFAGQQAGSGTNTIYDLDNNGDAIGMEGLSLAVTQTLNDKVEIAAAYGLNDYDAYTGRLANHTDSLETLHLSLRYKPVKSLVVGAEYVMTERKDFGGNSFDNNRIQLSAQFNF
ncbi:MAG: hypothetical protein E6Q73_03380 [Pseudorhodobacter sp.]|jgi:hypothetical protein|nr:MAG: hypothetical protein E6Q73_03380 [Pseudorhodobacter sp.]